MRQDHVNEVRNVLFIILLLNLLVAVLKMFIGAYVHSSSISADGLHSLSDGSSNIVGLIGVHLGAKPEDKFHPYGHSKFETLSGMFISVILFGVACKVVWSAIQRIKSPVLPKITSVSLVILVFTMVINVWIVRVEYKKGKELQSQILIADSMHTRSDVYVSIGVLLTMLGVAFRFPPILDPLASFIVSIFIFRGSYEIFRGNSDILVDKIVVDSDIIKAIVLEFEPVKDVHQIRSRGSQNCLYIDMHIMVQPHLSVVESHILVHNIERRIQENINSSAQVIVHLEPYYFESKEQT